MQQLENSLYVSFGGYCCRIDYQHAEVEELLTFLFGSMLVNSAADLAAHYEAGCDHTGSWVLACDGKPAETYRELDALGNFLAGDVLFKLIEPNNRHLAIHAGLVSKQNASLLLPAESGSGKTSVTAWLITHGWRYHTDELVLIDLQGHNNLAFSRPLNIKNSGLEPVKNLLGLDDSGLDCKTVRQAEGITMMHQSMFISEMEDPVKQIVPAVRSILFPHYDAGKKPAVELLTPAAAGLELMRSNVIARNLPGHGFSDIVNVVKTTPAYHLYYSHFDDLEALVAEVTSGW